MMARAGWLTLHIASGENAGRVILLPADRIVAVVELEGGAGLAYDDGGTMQVLETAAELAELLEDVDGSVVTLEGVRTKRRRRAVYQRTAEPVKLEPGAYAQMVIPTRAGDVVQRVLIEVVGRSSDGEAVSNCAHAFNVASPDLFSNHEKVPCALFSSGMVPHMGNMLKPVTGTVWLELSSNFHLPAYVSVTLFVQHEE